MTLVNELYRLGKATSKELETLLTLLNPVAPHMTEEMWETLGHQDLLSLRAWSNFDESKLVEDEVEIVVQINGKVKEKLMVSKDATKEEQEKAALALPKIQEGTAGKTVVKMITVPGEVGQYCY